MARDEDDSLNAKEIKEILAVLKDSDVSELELERGNGIRLRIRRGPAGGPAQSFVPQMMMAAPQQQQHAAPSSAKPEAAPDKPGKLITSPFVGTFYRAPSPD